ncbi:hypothetical protein SteCoe_16466 [Stentor coeruleus]|uniref:Uncharacterized protein n=1 Tax=Stentor coeruleus TaxID=5963 RepID=A0A1R2C1A5_9CILI|nr:hypothetical protein SteCoe_16466 [Stentor coeruleus]
MEPERAFPPPTFPVSLNTFYKTSPKNYKEKLPCICEKHKQRDYISKQVILKRRFPRLDVNSHASSVSPIRTQNLNDSPLKYALNFINEEGYMKYTDEITQKIRSKSPIQGPKAFVPINSHEAKGCITRIVSGCTGEPYLSPQTLGYNERVESVKKRVGGEFRSGQKCSFLNDNKAFLNSFNTFDTFKSIASSRLDSKSGGKN